MYACLDCLLTNNDIWELFSEIIACKRMTMILYIKFIIPCNLCIIWTIQCCYTYTSFYASYICPDHYYKVNSFYSDCSMFLLPLYLLDNRILILHLIQLRLAMKRWVFMHVCLVKTDQPRHLLSIIRGLSVCQGSLQQQWLWSNCLDSESDQSLLCRHML